VSGARWPVAVALAVALAGCASGRQEAAAAGDPKDAVPAQERINAVWALRTRAHVDLWLHGFAMVQDDTTLVPYFRPGYRDAVIAARNQANVETQLEANREQLRARFGVNRALVDAQFLAFYFASWEELQQALELFLLADGDPARARNEQTRAIVTTLARAFPSKADRDWLRLFLTSVRDENDKFYRTYWQQQQRELGPVLADIDSLWENTYLPKLQPYLNNSRLEAGDFLLSLPLDGEGRTIIGGQRTSTIATPFPTTREAAIEAIFVFAHEAISQVANIAVTDNTTPNEQRSGVSDRYTASALVRGGALLLERLAPELTDGYARYYLRAAKADTTGGDLASALRQTFPLPDHILNAMERQLDLVLGGI
jgi:hypothetical protein